MSFLKNISFTLFSRIAVAVINFVIIIIVSRVLGAENRGDIALIMVDIAFAQLVYGIVGGFSIVYHLPKVKDLGSILSLSFIVIVPVTILIHLIFNMFYDSPYRLWIIAISILMNINYSGMNIYIARKKMLINAIISLIAPIITLLVLVFMNFNSIHDYLIVFLFGQLLVTISLYQVWLELIKSSFKIDLNVWKSILNYGFSIEFNNAIQFLGYRISYYFLLWYLTDKASIGQFSNAVALCESLWIISRSVSTNQYIEIVNRPSEADKITIKSVKLIFLLLVPAMIILILIPNNFYEYVFTKEFSGLKHNMLFLLPGVFLFALSSSWSNYFSALNYNYINTIRVCLCLIITVIFLAVLVPVYGLVGAGVATSVGYAFSLLLLGWFYYFRNPSR